MTLILIPFSWRYRFITAWSHLSIIYAKYICGLRYHIRGLEHLPKTNAILVSNHQSTWETIFLQKLLPVQSWVLKRELLQIPFFGWGLALLQPVAINRSSGRAAITQLMEQGLARLKLGRWLVLFPEGTRVSPQAYKKFSKSAAALAEASGYPILPMAHNAGEFWPRGWWLKKPGVIEIVLGPLIKPQGHSLESLHAATETWIREHMSSSQKG